MSAIATNQIAPEHSPEAPGLNRAEVDSEEDYVWPSEEEAEKEAEEAWTAKHTCHYCGHVDWDVGWDGVALCCARCDDASMDAANRYEDRLIAQEQREE